MVEEIEVKDLQHRALPRVDVSAEEQLSENEEPRFAPMDLVYGPSAHGRLRSWQERRGGRLLTDIAKPMRMDWTTFSRKAMEQALREGNRIHFDLSNVDDISAVLEGTAHGSSSTTGELLYLKTHWIRFDSITQFYRNDRKVPPPW